MGLDNFGIKMVVSKDSFGRQSQNERSIFKKKQIITAASFGWMQMPLEFIWPVKTTYCNLKSYQTRQNNLILLQLRKLFAL